MKCVKSTKNIIEKQVKRTSSKEQYTNSENEGSGRERLLMALCREGHEMQAQEVKLKINDCVSESSLLLLFK